MADDSSRRPLLRRVLTALLAGVLLVLVLRQTDFGDLGRRLRDADFVFLALALLAYAGSYAARGLRFRLLLHSARPPFFDLFAVMAMHNLLNMLLPARTGELSYVVLARSRYGVPLAEGAASLLLSRLYDVLGIAVFFVAAFLCTTTAAGARELAAVAGLIVLGGILAARFVAPACEALQRGLERLGARMGATESGRFGRVLGMSRSLVVQLRHMQELRRGVPVFVVTQVQWLFTFLTCWFLLRASGVPFPLGDSILGSTGLSLALILPINTFGNVGTFEAGWAAGYVLAGMDRTTAASTGVAAHVFILAFAVVLGALGALRLRLAPATATASRRVEVE